MFLRKVSLHSKAQLLPLIPTQLTELLDLMTAKTSLALRSCSVVGATSAAAS
ncbi:hypothetical protein WGT02_39510 (plasmid) [Rhizobium sp. T1470]|uniref:hypothetical protein n=1 Tax=Rhizobium sp. T1470 TaxID=555320 RepID=UPI00040A21F1|nr:hypothetical protein [Rhizobium sp. T1473]MCA0804287.1 hypothetical protein [Rhizobium sp. T1473]